MATITFPSVNHQDGASAAVSTKSLWADDWTSQLKLHCRQLTLSASPGISSANCHWRIGAHLWPQEMSWQTSGVLSAAVRSYVRVVVDGTGSRAGYTWYGIWHSARMETDRQTFVANGIESLLDKPCLDAAYVDTNPMAPGAPSYAKRGLTFNKGGNGNRSDQRFTINGQACYIFAYSDTASYWSTRDVVEYLIAMATPVDESNVAIFNWGISGLTNLPDFDQPVSETHGRSYLSLLNSFVTRFRLTSWACIETTLTFFTFAASDITLTNNLGQTLGTIPQNSDSIVVDLSKDQSAKATLSTEASHVCDVVKVTGERRKSVYSLRSGADGTLAKKWTADQEADYITGASAGAGWPPDTEPALQNQIQQEARSTDEFAAVYSWFGTPDEWDQKSGDGQGGFLLSPVAINDDGTQFWIYPGELEFLPKLPLRTGYNYNDATLSNNVAKSGHRGDKTGDPPFEELPTFAIVKTLEPAEDYYGNIGQWMQIDNLSSVADLEPLVGAYRDADEGTTSDRRWSASVRPIRGEAVAEIRVHGESQHALAEDEFSLETDRVRGALDWKDIIITVCSYDTRYAEAQYPETVTPLGEYVETLRIEAPGHELIYVAPNTVVGLDYSLRTPNTSTGGYIQDDRDQLKLIAQRAYEWHKDPRYTLGFSSGYIDGAIQIGQLVTSYVDAQGTFNVGTVLTEITLAFPVSDSTQPQRPNASYVTAFGQLDPMKVV